MHDIDEENYPKLVEGSDKVFILKAGANWCAPCTASRGPFTELAEELKDKLQEDLETSEETQKDLERERVTMQKQLNDGFLQISALKVR